MPNFNVGDTVRITKWPPPKPDVWDDMWPWPDPRIDLNVGDFCQIYLGIYHPSKDMALYQVLIKDGVKLWLSEEYMELVRDA